MMHGIPNVSFLKLTIQDTHVDLLGSLTYIIMAENCIFNLMLNKRYNRISTLTEFVISSRTLSPKDIKQAHNLVAMGLLPDT